MYEKKNLRNRILSAVLAFVTLLSLLPMQVFSAQTEEAVVSEVTDQVQAQAAEVPAANPLRITLNGVQTDYMELRAHEKIEIYADGVEEDVQYQWQILHPEKEDLWVNIYDETTERIAVTLALVGNVLNSEDMAQLRCRAIVCEKTWYSSPITVQYREEEAGVPVTFAAYETAEAEEPTAPAKEATEPVEENTEAAETICETIPAQTYNSGVMPLAEGDDDSDFVTVTIEYVRYDIKWEDGKMVVDSEGNPVLEENGVQAFTPYIATLQKGTDLNTVVNNPTMVGYDTYLDDETTVTTSVLIDQANITTNITYTVKYKPATVDYSVRYYFQNVYDDLYVENTDAKQDLEGITGSTPPENVVNQQFEGFTSLYYQPDSIAADGSTVFEVYYERNYYLMEFNCNGGYGTDTVYVRYGTYISIPSPIRSGYVFDGWDLVKTEQTATAENPLPTLSDGVKDTLPAEMPMYNTGYLAIWSTTDTTYSVVYWIENADGTKTYIGNRIAEGKSAEKVSGTDDLTANTNVCGEQEHRHGTDCEFPCGLTEHEHGDGNCVYSCGKIAHDHTSGCYCEQEVHTTHQRSCYNFTANGVTVRTTATTINDPNERDPINGFPIYRWRRSYNDDWTYYVQIDGSYYQITGYGNNLNDNDLTYTLTCHTHSSACCTIEAHTHNDCTCTRTEHTHSDACYGCKMEEHTHTAACRTTEISYLEFVRADQNVVVEGDGSTVVNVYYKKKLFEIRFIYARYSNGRYEIADTTNAGVVGGWGLQVVNTLPTVKENSRFTSQTEVIDGYTYYYISLRAEYGANIEALWPGNVINDVTDTSNRVRRFGSWAAEDGTPYRANDAEHANIVGPYPYMSAEMIKTGNENIQYTDPVTGEKYYVAQRMSAWWGTKDGLNFGGWDHGPIDEHSYHIYYESTDGTGDRQYNGKWYDLVVTHEFLVAHNGSTRVDPFYYNGFTCINDTRDENNSNLNSNTDYQKNSANYAKDSAQYACPDDSCAYCNCFYYDRTEYTLSFVNYNTMSAAPASQTMKYGATLNNPGEPVYPSGIEPGAYEFQGWYTTAECYDGTEVKWDTATMPDGDLTVYAKWTPVTHTVRFYQLYDYVGTENWLYDGPKTVTHGELLETAYDLIPKREGYTFVGWFYFDEDNKKRFAPDSMEIVRDIDLFAEWQSGIDTTYEVTYVLQETVKIGDTTYSAGTAIADPTTGHTTAGKTKTFTAKGISELYPVFQTGIFPTVNSHSILMDEDGSENTYQFEYVHDDEVWYKIRYVDYVTRTEIATSVVKKTSNAIVTEKFLPINGYIPQNFYLRKALVADGETGSESNVKEENVITFYYTQDTEHGLYSVEYYLENADSTDSSNTANYTQYESIVGSADKDTIYTAKLRTYDGYTHVPTLNTVVTYNTDGSVKDTKTGVGANDDPPAPFGTIEYTGLTLRIYYQRNSYPYIIEYREYGAPATDPALDRIPGIAKFDSLVTYALKDDTVPRDDTTITVTKDNVAYTYEYYDKTDTDPKKSMSIRMVQDGKENSNKLIFYFTQRKVQVYYHAVCTVPGVAGFGAVSLYSESAATAAGLGGSGAMPADGFVFKGWYSDEACTTKVSDNWITDHDTNGSVTYLKPGTLDTTKDEVHYYALFEPVKEDLTITKNGENLEDDTFLFQITGTNALDQKVDMVVSIQGAGSVTIQDLYCGDYTVTELTNWSWTYSCGDAEQEVTLTSGDAYEAYIVTFANSSKAVDWLHGESEAEENQFTINNP